MSTQHINEADELADRVCVLSHGKVIALDLPILLKQKFGVGYSLIIETKLNFQITREKHAMIDSVLLGAGMMTQYIPENSVAGKKLVY